MKNKRKIKSSKGSGSVNIQIQQTTQLQQVQHQQPLSQFEQHQEQKTSRDLKSRAFWIWLSLNVLAAGLLCIVADLLINCWFKDEGFFYVINKEAFSGYFYALSVSLLAGSLSTLFISWLVGQNNKGKIALAILSIVLLCAVVCSYVNHSERLAELNAERDVENIDIRELVGNRAYKMYEKKEIDINALADSINTEILFDSIINKEQLKNTLVHIKLNIVEPQPHVNWLLVILTFSSFAVSIITFRVTYPSNLDWKSNRE